MIKPFKKLINQLLLYFMQNFYIVLAFDRFNILSHGIIFNFPVFPIYIFENCLISCRRFPNFFMK